MATPRTILRIEITVDPAGYEYTIQEKDSAGDYWGVKAMSYADRHSIARNLRRDVAGLLMKFDSLLADQ